MSNFSEGTSNEVSVDVVIVGAGFAGLSAAEHLVTAGASVLVLEGKDRVGGRSFTGELAGVKVDFGATWVSERHTAIRDLAKKVGCSTTSQYDHGENVLWMAGDRHLYTNAIPLTGPIDIENFGRVLLALEELLATVDVEAVWNSPNASELDAISLGEWLDQQEAAASTHALMNVVTKVQWGCGPGDVSLLHALRYIQAVDGLEHMLEVKGGQNQDRITESTQEIAKRVAKQLGDRVILSTPARRITQNDDGITVYTDAKTINAQYAIVAIAPAYWAGIEFEPALPEKAQGLARTWPMGVASKAFVAYETPFWRAEGLSGEALLDTGAAFITFDASPNENGPGILMVFCNPRVFDGFSPEIRRDRVIQQLVNLYGTQASSPIDYVDHCWGAEPFAPGGPNPAVAPFAYTTYGSALAESHGRIHWAGTEYAGEWVGTMNGAVITGRHAAEQVAKSLGF